MLTNQEICASCVCEAQLNALCFKVFIRFGQEKGSWLGCWGEGWRGPTLATTTRLPEYNVGSPHSFMQWGYWTKIQDSFFVVQLVPYKAFFLKSNCFIAMQGVLEYKHKTVGKYYQYWHSPWRTPGWLGEVSSSESWQAVIQHICGE